MKSLPLYLAAAALLLALAAGANPAAVKPTDRNASPGGGGANSGGATFQVPPAWFVELSSAPLTEANPSNESKYLAKLKQEKQSFRLEAAAAGLRFRERYAYDRLWNGLSVEVDPADLPSLYRLSGVAALYPVAEVDLPPDPVPVDPGAGAPELFTAITMTGAADLHEEGIDGTGVRVGIIDTGIDYTHPDLGRGFGPGHRVEGGYDFVGDLYLGPASFPQPDGDPMDCNGHGTHVAGIIGANGGVVGVAPGVTFRSYKIFGCAGGTATDVILAAMERALADGNQVINLSLGSTFQWPRYPTGRAADNLVNHGVVVVASAGNDGGTGLYSMAAPAVGEKTIAVASVDNARVHTRSFRILGGPAVGYLPASNADPPPLSGSALVKDVGHGCSTERALFTGLQGKIAVMARGRCSLVEKALNARNAGATAALIYNDSPGIFFGLAETPVFFPVATLSGEDGTALAARARFSTTLVWTADLVDLITGTGGLVSTFSSYGDSPDLLLKPDVSAPGAFIFSTLPLTQGGYGLLSGTSMSSPHVAGAAALLLQARPNTPTQIVRDLLQNGSVPRPWRSAPSGGALEPAHHQGSGMIDIKATVHSDLKAFPGKISLGEMEGRAVTRTLVIQNAGALPVTLALSHLPALATLPDTFHVQEVPAAAGVTFAATEVTVAAGNQASVDVTFTQPEGLAEGGLFGGYLVITPSPGGRELRVPYSGVKGDYQALVALNQDATGLGNPVLSDNLEFALNEPISIDPRLGQAAFVLFHLAQPVRKLRMEIFDAASGRSFGRLLEIYYFPRSVNPDTFYFFTWTGLDKDGVPVPAGTYTIRFSVEKALGDDDNPAHWEVWNSPGVTIVR
jgi:minor extracellular serine protease Vpr